MKLDAAESGFFDLFCCCANIRIIGMDGSKGINPILIMVDLSGKFIDMVLLTGIGGDV